MKLNNKVSIIVGGARGIGKAIAALFAKEGSKVVIVSRTNEEINNTVNEIKHKGYEAIGVAGDISKWNDIQNVLNKTIEAFSTVNILVNGAGVQVPIGSFLEVDIEEWKKNIQINFFGTAMFCKAVLPIMAANREGKIINFSGGGATSPRVNFSAYGTAKTAVVRFTETLAEEIKEFNIQVNAIAPGAVNTKMLNEILDSGKSAGIKELEDAQTRAEKGGTLPEIPAELALFLASDRSDGLTGKLISAVWDNWKNFDTSINDITKSSLYTLRRLDDRNFIEVK